MLSIVFPYRNDCEARNLNLRAVLAYYAQWSGEVEFVVVEQAVHSALPSDLKKSLLFPHKLVRLADDGPFNRGKCLNAGANSSTGEFVAYNDVDCFLPLSELDRVVSLLGTSDVVLPKARCVFLSRQETRQARQAMIHRRPLDLPPCTRQHAPSSRSGGICVVRRSLALEDSHGRQFTLKWPEVAGWGAEDWIFDLIALRCVVRLIVGTSTLFHLFHGNAHRLATSANFTMLEQIANLGRDELLSGWLGPPARCTTEPCALNAPV